MLAIASQPDTETHMNRIDYTTETARTAIRGMQTAAECDHTKLAKLQKAVAKVEDGAPFAAFTVRGIRHVVKPA